MAYLKQGDSCVCSGNAGSDAEVRTTSTGKTLCTFSIAAKQLEQTNVYWQRCTVWDNSPFFELASSIAKGDAILATGRLMENTYQKNGEDVKTVDLWVDFLAVTGRNTSRPVAREAPVEFTDVSEEEELPF